MPVRKYSSAADMPGPPRLHPLDPQNLRIACELSELAFALHPWRFEPGVRKFGSAGEASRHRQQWERRQARSAWPIRAYQLGDEPSTNLRGSTTPSERLAMMWELARQSWSLSGRPFPEYRRSEIPGRIARLSE